MNRSVAAAVVLLALAACSRKPEVIEAASASPAASPAAGQGNAMAPAQPGPVQGDEQLPPGHPSLDGMAAPDGAAAPAPGMGAMPEAPAHGAAMSAGADVGDVKVPKAKGPDARTVAEVLAQRAELKGKTVTVQGKVVKFNAGIMKKNWLHLRDGTGKAGANDVTVTSQEAAQVGEVVTVRGTVAVDKDIGMGTPYPVIIEDAKVSR